MTTSGWRTYEVYQRERVGQSTALIRSARELISPRFAADPYPLLDVLRENYPYYRDWVGNALWLTRYDDVTSVFVDDANFETRSKLWRYGRVGFGRDVGHELPVLVAEAQRLDAVADDVAAQLTSGPIVDFATDVAARYPLELLGRVVDVAPADLSWFGERYWTMQRGAGWNPEARVAGSAALDELAAWFDELVLARRADPGDDLVSAIAQLDVEGGPTTGADVAVTLLEADHQTLHGALANLWFLLLTHPDQLAEIADDRRRVRLAWFEALRHSAPVVAVDRFARHEVERFGRLIPEGGRVVCAAAAANRDPRHFHDADQFMVGRKDLCQREARGQYRADGLPSGIAFGLGPPSKHPARPEDRPRSRYAITLDLAVALTNAVLDAHPAIALAPAAEPTLRSLRIGEMHTCWSLPVTT